MAIPFDPKEASRAVDEALAFVLRETAKPILRTLVFASPVGDPTLWQNPDAAPPGYVGGKFRANWQVDVTNQLPIDDELDDVDAAGADTIRAGEIMIETARTGDLAIWIVNNLPYGGPLNDGHSTQAPAGFVEQAIAAGVATLIPGPEEI